MIPNTESVLNLLTTEQICKKIQNCSIQWEFVTWKYFSGNYEGGTDTEAWMHGDMQEKGSNNSLCSCSNLDQTINAKLLHAFEKARS